ncbi:MAG: RagB/SusD family nutrient uptake outer membrane protein, partial [Flavobacteriaceae bacterium]
MKKVVVRIGVLSILMVPFFSCEDILEEVPEDRTTIVNFFQTMDNLEQSVTATYRQMVDNAWNRGMGGARSRTVFMGADDWTSQPGGNKGDFKEGDQLAISSSNTGISLTGWDMPYDVIFQANFSILGQQELLESGTEATAVNALAAEAYFLRAWAYFRLVRLYGGVPIVLNPEYSEGNSQLPRASVEEVYQQILADLQFAITHLPTSRTERARVDQWVAKALRAKVYLTMASWPLKATENVELALQDAQDVIDNGPFMFEDDFAGIFAASREDTNSEYIWQLKFCNNIDCPGAGLITPFASQTTKPAELGGFQDLFIEKAFFNKFPEGARKDHTFLTQ